MVYTPCEVSSRGEVTQLTSRPVMTILVGLMGQNMDEGLGCVTTLPLEAPSLTMLCLYLHVTNISEPYSCSAGRWGHQAPHPPL